MAKLVLVVSLVVACGCSRAERRDTERIDLTQTVTSDRRPQDKDFADFEKSWRRFVSTSPELAMPVTGEPAARSSWEPSVVPECVSSAGAGALVPQVTLTWNDPADDQAPRLRVDLALHHDGFGRNFYSSALTSNLRQRFMLPSGSGLLANEEAVLFTGPGLFPMLWDFTTEATEDRDSGRRFARRTLVLRDLAPGLTYTIRLDRPGDNRWIEDRRFIFLTPVCPR